MKEVKTMKRLCKQVLTLMLAVAMVITAVPFSAVAVSASESSLAITTQPHDVTAEVGDTVYFTVAATGSGLSYQWEYSSNGGTTWKTSAYKTTQCKVSATTSRNGWLYRCVVTDKNGDTVTSDAATLMLNVLAITTQPQDVTAEVGDTVYFTVAATGSGLSYQWEYSSNGGTTWKTSAYKTTQCKVSATTSRNGWLYRCVVTDENGDTVTSDAATLTLNVLAITTQPQDVTAEVGETVYFTVAATGSGLSYQWEYSSNGGTTWKTSAYKTTQCKVSATTSRNGWLYRCVVTDENGDTVTSDAATLMLNVLAITTQPHDVTAEVGETVCFTVAATGSGLSYQWEYSSNGGTTWKTSSYKSTQCNVSATASRNGWLYRCVVTDENGDTVTSDTATLTVNVLAVTTQPQDVTAEVGETVCFTVAATGSGLSYQWEYSSNSGTTWKTSSYKSTQCNVSATASRNGWLYRCVVTDENGDTVTSDTATLTVNVLAITTQPQNVTAEVGDTAYFTVEATGSGLSYQWEYSSNGGTTWKASSYKSTQCNVGVTESKDGWLYRCVVTDENGDTVTSDAAMLSIATISITVQPEDWTGSVGSRTYFTVLATGTDLTYQWQISTNGGTTWSNSSVTGTTYQTTIKESYDGVLYRCMIYNEDGEIVYSRSATLNVSDTFEIVAQPEDQYNSLGETVNFYIQAGGSDVSYQWQVSEDGTDEWTDLNTSSATKPRLQLTVSISTISMYYRCMLTNGDGETLTSTAVRLLCSDQGFISYGDNGYIYYVDEDGTLHTGALTLDNDTYYFYSNGRMARGITRVDGGHIYLDYETGVQQFGLVEVGVGWYMYFSETDGTAQTGLMKINGKLYYFSEEESKEGVSESGLVEIDGNIYYFDSTTKQAVTGFITDGDNTYYADSDYNVVTGLQIIDGDAYYFDDSGIMKYGMYKTSDGTRYYFDEETGKAITGFLTLASGRVYYFDGANGGLTGLQEINGELYYLNSNSVVQYGRYLIDDCYYIFDTDTGAALSGWGEYISTTGTTYTMYFDPETHAAVTGFQEIDGQTYYFNSSNGFMRTGLVTIDDTSYYFDLETGVLANGFVTRQNGRTYYFVDGQASLTGLQTIDGAIYYLSSSGYIASGRQKDGDYYYMFDAVSGQAVSGWWTYITTSGSVYTMYFDPETYQAVTGLQTIDGETYYFNTSGCMQSPTSTTIDGTRYYFDKATGATYSGTAASNGNTWETIDGCTYYYDIYGEPVTGLRVIENVLYYFDESGVMQTGLVTADNGKTYYFSESGVAQTGIQTIDGDTYYFSTADGTMVTGFCNISGSVYCFGESGVQETGWVELYSGMQSFIDSDTGLVTGLFEIDGNTYYFNYYGVMMTGIQSVTDDSGNDVAYFFDENGVRQNGMITYKNKTYYFDEETSERCTGWITIDDEEYYFNTISGQMSKGLTVIDDRYYYFNSDTGVKETGLISYGGRYYYVSEDTGDGLYYGLIEIDGQTYYFNTSGFAATGYLNLDGVRYYFDPDTGASISCVYWVDSERAYAFVAGGGCATGMVEYNGNTYYANLQTEKIVTGLHSVGDVLYYFDEDGIMLKDTEVEIAGITYEIDEDGSVSASGDSGIAALINSGIEKLGIPYGSEADNSSGAYSCSSLVSAVLSDAGIDVGDAAFLMYYSLTHDDYDVTTISSTDELNPGDIIFVCNVDCQYGDDCTFWNEIHHVAIYLGDGKILESLWEGAGEQSGVLIRDWSESAASFIYAIVRCNDLS